MKRDNPKLPAISPPRRGRRNAFGGNPIEVPIAHAKVEIWRLRARAPFNAVGWGKDADATTDANGNISVKLDFITAGITYAVRVFATNHAATVWPEQAWRIEPFWREPGQGEGGTIQRVATLPNSTLDFSHTFRERWIAQHFNLAETLRIGRDYFAARRKDGDVLGRVNVSISEVTPSGSSFYDFLIDELVIGIGDNAFDAFNDRVVLHEYGHHVLDQISKTSLTPAAHSGCPRNPDDWDADPEFAWQEGAADYLAFAVRRVNSQRWLQFELPLDAAPTCAHTPGSEVEARVTAALWDIADTGTTEAFDRLSGMDTAVLQVMDSGMDNGVNGTIHRFRAAWAAAALDVAPLDAILVGNGIPTG